MYQKGFSKSTISRELDIHRTTVTNYLDTNISPINGNYGATRSNTVLSPYHSHINQLLSEGYTFKNIEESIKAKGYTGSSSTIRMYATRMKNLYLIAIFINFTYDNFFDYDFKYLEFNIYCRILKEFIFHYKYN